MVVLLGRLTNKFLVLLFCYKDCLLGAVRCVLRKQSGLPRKRQTCGIEPFHRLFIQHVNEQFDYIENVAADHHERSDISRDDHCYVATSGDHVAPKWSYTVLGRGTIMTSTTPQDLAALQRQLGTDNANAVAQFVDGRITTAFADNRSQLEEMAARVEQLFAQQGATPQVVQAAQAVGQAAAANEQASQGTPSQADAQADSVRVEQARRVVGQADPDIRATLAVHQQCIIDLQTGLTGVTAGVEGAQTTAARAIAIARSGEGGALLRASRVALTVFAIVGVFYWLVWWLTPLNYQWQTNLGLAMGVGALAGWIAALWSGQRRVGSAVASAEAASGHGGLDIINGGGATSSASVVASASH